MEEILEEIETIVKISPKKEYLIHDNGSRPFKVSLSKIIKIYKEEFDNGDYTRPRYDKEILEILNYKKIFIGLSPKNSSTIFSGGYGKEFDGNSILIYDSKFKYIYIGSEIYEFNILENDRKNKIDDVLSSGFRTKSNIIPSEISRYIKEYSDEIYNFVSPVGNNDVPYPYAVSSKYIYCLLEDKYFCKEEYYRFLTNGINLLKEYFKEGFLKVVRHHPKLVKAITYKEDDFCDPYSYLYGQFINFKITDNNYRKYDKIKADAFKACGILQKVYPLHKKIIVKRFG